MTNRRKVSIVVAGHHQILREGLNVFLKNHPDFSIVGDVSNYLRLKNKVLEVSPDVVIIDLTCEGRDIDKWLTPLNKRTGAIVITWCDDVVKLRNTIAFGVAGIVSMDKANMELYEAITTVSIGRNYYSPKIANVIASAGDSNKAEKAFERENKFSSSEEKVIQHVCEDLSCKEIASKMDLSTRTIEGYRRSIIKKMGVKGTAGILKYAVKTGMYICR